VAVGGGQIVFFVVLAKKGDQDRGKDLR
jgi:hypothetical protein